MLAGKVALISGASRGIGRECALALAGEGCSIVIAAKSDTPQPTLPGSIHTVAEEVRALGAQALPLKVDVRDDASVSAAIAQTEATFGRLDILINNASALWWKNIADTPMSRFDLMMSVNARGTFALTHFALPLMTKEGSAGGHIVNMSPPIDLEHLGGKTGYFMSKYGMTLCALGAAQEFPGVISANSLWPATLVESLASKNFGLGGPEYWRKATVLSDCVMHLVQEDPAEFSGQMLIDEDYLRTKGVTDFAQYQCVPGCEPPKMSELAISLERGRAGSSRL